LLKLPDVQAAEPEVRLGIDWVTVSGVKMPAGNIVIDGHTIVLVPEVSASVSLPSTQRAIHASRSYEIIAETLPQLGKRGSNLVLENLAPHISKELLRRHPYSTASRVRIKAAAYFNGKPTATGHSSYEPFEVYLRAVATRVNSSTSVRSQIGVAATGLTACPCAQEAVREIYRKMNGGNLDEDAPVGTHMQRSLGVLLVETAPSMRVMDLVTIVRSSLSSGAHELLKRHDEAQLVIEALSKPRFVEDSARASAAAVVAKYPDMSDDSTIFVRVKSLESIHNHNLEATLRTTAGRVRKQLRHGLET